MTLFNLRSEINGIHQILVKKLDLSIKPTNVGAQKIDNITLNTYKMVVATFLVINKAN